jgi:hypothetical protein
MKLVASLAAWAALAGNANVLVRAEPCPFREKGDYPWSSMVPKIVEGDLWAWVYLDLDKHGRPLRCYIGESNLVALETRSNVCRSFVSGWRAAPLMQNGQAVAGTTRRLFIIMGRRHERLFEEARTRWMSEHSKESANCYSEGAGRGLIRFGPD